MKIFIICSKTFYDKIPAIKQELEAKGHIVCLPNYYDKPRIDEEIRKLGTSEYIKFVASMFQKSGEIISNVDAILVLNMTKNGTENYIGGATFLEMYDAFRMGKRIYLYNPIPTGIMNDEIVGFNPIIINGDLSKI